MNTIEKFQLFTGCMNIVHKMPDIENIVGKETVSMFLRGVRILENDVNREFDSFIEEIIDLEKRQKGGCHGE